LLWFFIITLVLLSAVAIFYKGKIFAKLAISVGSNNRQTNPEDRVVGNGGHGANPEDRIEAGQ